MTDHHDWYDGLRDDDVAAGVFPARRAEQFEWRGWEARAYPRPVNPCRSCAEQWFEPAAPDAGESCDLCREAAADISEFRAMRAAAGSAQGELPRFLCL